MKFFVTGTTGFIGGRLARALVARGHQVIAVVRDPARAQDLAALGVEIHRGDITDPASLRAPMTGADGVYHVAGWYKIGVRDRSAAQAVNVEGTRNVLELMRDLGIPKGVYTSTLAVFSDTHGQMVDESYYFGGQHLSEYDRTKWEAHYQVALPMMKQGLPLVIVQPGLVYGPGDPSETGNTFRQYLQGRLPMLPRRTAFTWGCVDDIAEGHILAMDKGKPGESYIIAGPPHTFVEAVHLAEQITGIPAPRLEAPPTIMKAMASLMSVVERVMPVPALYASETLRTSAGVTYLGTNAKARLDLGYNPRPLAAGLPDMLAYEMQQLGIRPRK